MVARATGFPWATARWQAECHRSQSSLQWPWASAAIRAAALPVGLRHETGRCPMRAEYLLPSSLRPARGQSYLSSGLACQDIRSGRTHSQRVAAGRPTRIAHSLWFPAAVPNPVPFDFERARWRSWLPNVPAVRVQYFNHLCATEAGEWIFKTVKDVEGLYFARPQGPPTSEVLADPYGPEMPWIQRQFLLKGDRSPLSEAAWLIQPPIYNYRFVEEPRREVKWQAQIHEPYVRLMVTPGKSSSSQAKWLLP